MEQREREWPLTRIAADGTLMAPVPFMPLPVAFTEHGPQLVAYAVYLAGEPA